MKEERDSIPFTTEDGDNVEFYILEQTMLNGCNYLLVTDTLDDEEDEVEVLILKDTSAAEEEIANYELLEDDAELEAVFKLFEELLDEED